MKTLTAHPYYTRIYADVDTGELYVKNISKNIRPFKPLHGSISCGRYHVVTFRNEGIVINRRFDDLLYECYTKETLDIHDHIKIVDDSELHILSNMEVIKAKPTKKVETFEYQII